MQHLPLWFVEGAVFQLSCVLQCSIGELVAPLYREFAVMAVSRKGPFQAGGSSLDFFASGAA